MMINKNASASIKEEKEFEDWYITKYNPKK